jgi:4,5-DOPA dioxygenase extradiol
MKLNDLDKIASDQGSPEIMPVLFLGHGSPMNAIEENEFVAGFRNISKVIPVPKAILCISAHWETRGTLLTAMDRPKTIHDFGGFPEELFRVQYPAPGSPELASKVKSMLTKTEAQLDQKWGLDHGAWSVIRHMYPNADIPVIQMSLDYYQTIGYHYELAQELSSLREKGILIAGSGNMVHNLGMVAWDRLNDDEYAFNWAAEAGNTMKQLIQDGNHQNLIKYQSLGSAFRMAVPTPEHFLPLLYVLAMQKKNEPVSLFNDRIVAGSISMCSVKIG